METSRVCMFCAECCDPTKPPGKSKGICSWCKKELDEAPPGEGRKVYHELDERYRSVREAKERS